MNVDINQTLAVLFVSQYNTVKIMQKRTYIPYTTVAQFIMLPMYKKFIGEGLLVPLEQLPEEKKLQLVDECRQQKDIFFTNKILIEQSKILHLINEINNNT